MQPKWITGPIVSTRPTTMNGNGRILCPVTGLGTKRYGFHYTVVYATIHSVVVRISYLKTPTPLAPRLCQLYSVVTRRLFQSQLAQTITTPCMHRLEMFVAMSG